MMDDKFWDELLEGAPIPDTDALCEQVAGLLDGENVAWIKRISRTGFLTVSELLALVLCQVREPDQPVRNEKKVIINWAKLVREALSKEQITALDPDSHSPISSRNEEGWNWETSLHYADQFFKQTGTNWRCAQIVKKLLQSKKEKVVDTALKIHFLKLIRLLATDEAYGHDPSKRTRAVSLMQKDLQTVGFDFSTDTIRKYVIQAINANAQGLSMSTIQKLAIGFAVALHGYKPKSPDKSLYRIVKDSDKRGGDLKLENLEELLEIASHKIPRKPA
jgi:hypothetical protein